MAQRALQNCRLFSDFFCHKVFEAAFIDHCGVDLDHFHRAVCDVSVGIADFHTVTGDDRPVTFIEISDLVRHRGQRNRVGTHEHLTRPMPDGKWGAFACRNKQIVVTVEKEAKRIGAFQSCDRLLGRITRRKALINVVLRQQGDGLCVRIGRVGDAFLGQKLSQFFEVLNNAVVNHSHAACAMRVGVVDGGGTVRRPARVADTRLSRKRVVHQDI